MRFSAPLIPLLFLGCAMDGAFTVTPAELPPVVMEKPMTKAGIGAPKDVKVEVTRICRGTRGGVMLLALTNQNAEPIEFAPRQIGVQLSSGYRHRLMTATEFQQMCEQFGGATYGIREEDEALTGQWSFPEEDARFVIGPGEKKVTALAFGAQKEEAWLTLDFDASIRRESVPSKVKHQLAVALPDVMPPRKAWLPEWLNFGFAFTNAG